MGKDPIVDEIGKNRKNMLDGFGGNIDKLMDYLKNREKSEKGRTFISKPVLRKRYLAEANSETGSIHARCTK